MGNRDGNEAGRQLGNNEAKGKGRKGNYNNDVRMAGEEEGKKSKAMALATRMAGKWTATATKRAMTTAMRVVGKQWQRQQRGQ